jgi:hypothetical protein
MTEIYQENISNISKYNYRINENETEMFIFEVVLKKFTHKNQKLRIIKDCRIGQLLTIDNNINYNDIKKIMITAIDINNPHKEIMVECLLNQTNKHTLFFNNDLFIEFYEKDGLLESNYNIINI